MPPAPAPHAGAEVAARGRAGPRADGQTWWITVGLGLLAAVATLVANLVIVRAFPDAARPDDLLFDLLPYVRPARWLTLVALVLGFGVFLADLLRRDGWASRRLQEAATAFAVMYLVRGGMTVLTPLAPAQGEEPFIFTPQQYGMFPSGHTAAITLLLLLTPADRTGPRRAQWLALALMVAGLLLARGHYSIDIVGGLLLGYVVVHAVRSWRLLAPLTGRMSD